MTTMLPLDGGNFQSIIASYGSTAVAAIFISLALAFLRLRSSRAPLQMATNVAVEDDSPPKVRHIPGPGEVKVSKILIHPIKSCRGISVQEARYTREGLENDRVFSIIDSDKLCIITARDVSKMVLITPTLLDGGLLQVSFPKETGLEPFTLPASPTPDVLGGWTELPNITIWPGCEPVDAFIARSANGPDPSTVLTQYFGRPVHLVYKGPRPRVIDATEAFPQLEATAKYQDMYPLLVLSEESIGPIDQEVKQRVGTQGIDESWKDGGVVIERFRPNIVFRGGGPFAEDEWEEITIGSESAPTILLVSKCTRCLLPNVSPETGERDAAVPYKVLMKFRTGVDAKHRMKPCVGCNGVPLQEGIVRVGDSVFVKKLTG